MLLKPCSKAVDSLLRVKRRITTDEELWRREPLASGSQTHPNQQPAAPRARRCRHTIAVLATLSVVAGAVGMLDAEPSGASVIAVGGAVVFVSPPPLISPTSIPSDGSIVAFTERTAYTLPTSLPVDITPSTFPTTYTGLGPLTPNTLAAGTPVDSYFMVAPVWRFLYDATVTFSTPILGLIIETSTLRATNSIVGAPGTTYEDFPSQGLKGDDYVELVGPSTIHMDLRSSEFVDEVRVITAASPSTSPGGYGQGGSTGYTEVASDGGIFNFETQFDGSMGGQSLNQPMVGGAGVTGQPGYWTVAKDGGIFSFGSAGFYGSMGGRRLNSPIVGMASTPDGLGYWLVASDGGVFSISVTRVSSAPLEANTSMRRSLVWPRHRMGMATGWSDLMAGSFRLETRASSGQPVL